MGILIFVMLILPLILTLLNILNLFLKKKALPRTVDFLIMTLGPLLTYYLYNSEVLKYNYFEALHLPSDRISGDWHTPIASWHLTTIITFAILAILGYLVIRLFGSKLPPLVLVTGISFMIIGSLLSAMSIIQLSANFFSNDGMVPIFLSLFPLNYIICSFALTRKVIIEYKEDEQKSVYKNPFLRKCNQILHKSKNWPLIAFILTVPILAIIIIILTLFGQQPSAAIKAFTETSDWMLSQKISPPAIYENTPHYLCTVSLKGHPSLVRPLRYGIRRNKKIILNRQLCVANAFEQLIQERTPNLHRIIRNFYDKYGYPLSKHIKTPISADIIYILMKPLEWFFVFILYIADKKPEDRIAGQYIPIELLRRV